MKKKNILLALGVLTLVTGCNSNAKETIKDVVQIKYDGKELVYKCSDEEISNLKNVVKVIVKENQLFTVVDSNKENKTYQAGSHKLKGNPNAEKCYFVDNAPIENNQYGTQTPIRKNTQENGIVSISMYGKFTYRIKDAVKFSEIYTDDDVYLTTLRTYLINHYTTHAAQINYNDIILETKMSQDI